MSCGNLCPCQFKWPLDTQGSKRDPINSEKAWLDFAVRLLSREEVGKGRGQETVWSEKCKPQWWDNTVGLPWKNPTANPKDTKEVLQTKFTALEKHLVASGRFPKELEEEAQLWNAGKYKELFLLTSLTSLLGKVTGVHSAVIAACEKVDDLKAEVNGSLLSDIKQCLSSALQATENFRIKSHSKPVKRAHSPEGKENSVGPKQKYKKRELKPKPSVTQPTIKLTREETNSVKSKASEQSLEILNLAQKLVAKSKSIKGKGVPSNLVAKREQKIQPKPLSTESSRFPNLPQTTNAAVRLEQATPTQQLNSPPCLTISQAELTQLLQGSNLVIQSQPIMSSRLDSNCSNANCLTVLNISEVKSSDAFQVNNCSLQTDSSPSVLAENFVIHKPNQDPSISNNKAMQNCEISEEKTPGTPEFDLLLSPPVYNLVEEEIFSCNTSQASSSDSLHTNASNSPTHQIAIDSASETTQLLSVLENASDSLMKQAGLDLPVLSTTTGTRTSLGRLESSGGSSSGYNNGISDCGYHSDDSNVDLDKMYSLEEQDQLWEEDGSFLLDKFLLNLEEDGDGDLGLLNI